MIINMREVKIDNIVLRLLNHFCILKSTNNNPTMRVGLFIRTLSRSFLGWVGKVRLRFWIEKGGVSYKRLLMSYND